jgi:hypothetical protein
MMICINLPPGSVNGNRLEAGKTYTRLSLMTKRTRFRSFKTSPEIVQLAVIPCVRFQLSLRDVEDRLQERGIGINQVTAGNPPKKRG